MRIAFALVLSLGLAACSSNGTKNDTTPPPTATPGTGEQPPPPEQPAPTERPQMTAEDCEAQGGTVVGDIGDGAVHRPDYRCPNGEAPIGTVPLGVEGSVCCPGPAQ